MDEDSQWYVIRDFLTLVASYLVIKVVQSEADKQTPTAFKNFETSLTNFQIAIQEDVVENGRPETEKERLERLNDGQ